MKEEKIILYDSPEAARLLTPEDLVKTPVWVARDPYNFRDDIYTTNEHRARYAGCTHRTCPETGEIFEKGYSNGPTVRARRERERYEALRQVEVTPDTMFSFYDGEKIYDDEDELFEALVNRESEGIGMVTVAMPVEFRELTTEYWDDEIPEDCYLDSPKIDNLIRQLNLAIAAENPAYYALCEARPTDEFLDGLKTRFQEYRKEWLQQQ